MRQPQTGVSFVIPVFNSQLLLPELYQRLTKMAEQEVFTYEIILVNDGSRDDSWAEIQQLSRVDKHVRGVNLMRNFGQHNALLAGIGLAKYDVIVTLDDDLQNPPEAIPLLLEKLAEGFDVVYGVSNQPAHGLFRNMATWLTKLAIEQAVQTKDIRRISPFRAFRTELRGAFRNYQNPFVSVDVLLSWGASRFSEVPVRHDPRKIGKSNYRLKDLIIYAFNLLTGLTTWPLRVSVVIGVIILLFGVGILSFVIAAVIIYGRVAPGFAFLASIITIFSGAQLFALGIIGEYLARLHFRLLEKPVFLIKEDTADQGKEKILNTAHD